MWLQSCAAGSSHACAPASLSAAAPPSSSGSSSFSCFAGLSGALASAGAGAPPAAVPAPRPKAASLAMREKHLKAEGDIHLPVASAKRTGAVNRQKRSNTRTHTHKHEPSYCDTASLPQCGQATGDAEEKYQTMPLAESSTRGSPQCCEDAPASSSKAHELIKCGLQDTRNSNKPLHWRRECVNTCCYGLYPRVSRLYLLYPRVALCPWCLSRGASARCRLLFRKMAVSLWGMTAEACAPLLNCSARWYTISMSCLWVIAAGETASASDVGFCTDPRPTTHCALSQQTTMAFGKWR